MSTWHRIRTNDIATGAIVRTKRTTITALAAAGAAVVAIVAAPSASAAATRQGCYDTGGSTQCTTPGDVQIYTSPHALPQYAPATRPKKS